jgi:tetratricopeptide (TPR) repeat protein
VSPSPDALRSALEERIRHARRDLEELERQVEEGEIDEDAASELRARYRADLAAAEQSLEGLPEPARAADLPKAESHPEEGRPARAADAAAGKRVFVIAGVVLVALTIGIVFIATSGEDPPSSAADPASAASLPAEGGDVVAQMEAAVAAQPENTAMRLALANLYFERRDYMAAMNHYSTLLGADPTPQEAAVANARIGWMSYDALDEPAMAVEFLNAAVAADPEYGEAKLFLGVVLLYGMEDPEAALPILEEVLELPDFPEELRPEVEQMIDDARAGGGGE